MIAVKNIADCVDQAEDMAALMVATWPEHYTDTGPGDALAAVHDRIAARSGGVAMMDGKVCGTVAVAPTSFGAEPHEGTWLIGLCVAPAYRERGIATALVQWASEQTDKPLFTTTKDAFGLLNRLGWVKIREVSDDTGIWRVMMAPPR